MKLETTIAPRRTGVVRLVVADGTEYEFAPDEDKRLIAEVSDQHVAALLETGNFVPANEDDFDAANTLLLATQDEGGADDEGEDDDEGDEDSPGAPPIEAGTPPQPARGRKAKKKAE